MKTPKAIYLPFLILTFVTFTLPAQQRRAIDSLRQIVAEAEPDTARIRILIALGEEYKYILPDSAMACFNEALVLSEKANSRKHKAVAFRQIGIVKENQGLYDRALEEYLKALAVYEEMDDRDGIARCYNDIAIIHFVQESYELSEDYLTRSFEIKQELGDQKAIANYFNNMATVRNSQGKYESAIDFIYKSIEISRELNDKEGIAVGYGNVGTIQSHMGAFEAALESHLRSIEIHREINNTDGMAHSYSNVSNVYLQMADSTATSDAQRIRYLNKTIHFGDTALALAKEIDARFVMNFIAMNLKEAYSKLGNYKKALEYADMFISTRDSLFNEEKTRAIQEMQAKYETEKKQQQIELQQSQIVARDATIKQQKTYRNALGAGLLGVVIIVVVIIFAYVQKRRDNRKILEQNEQIREANEELTVLNEQIREANEELTVLNEAISNQNSEILDSINYAQRIQTAMLPPEAYFNELLHDSFILFRPRDIVSGDFFWIKQVNRFVILVAADCTGHGVPGAFMSLLGISYLNEIVRRREITRADQVLDELRNQVKHSLRQHGLPDESKDGMDMAICVIDEENRSMQYSGAYIPVYLFREEQGNTVLKEIKADRMPIGYYQGRERPFTNHDIQLERGDTIYLFSDGFIDQKGGKDNRKFLSRNFKDLLTQIQDEPMYEQKRILERKLDDWMNGQAQVDDIMVIGIRF